MLINMVGDTAGRTPIERVGDGETFVGFYSDKGCNNEVDISDWDGVDKLYAKFGDFKVVTWADGTDKQIAGMVKAADEGEINLTDYWSVGDIRQVPMVYSGETHYVDMVLVDAGDYILQNGKACSFIVGQRDVLPNASFYLNHSGGYSQQTELRDYLNGRYRDLIPEPLRGIFKRFRVYYGGNSPKEKIPYVEDYFAPYDINELASESNQGTSASDASMEEMKYIIKRFKFFETGGLKDVAYTRNIYGSTIYRVDSYGSVSSSAIPCYFYIMPFGCI